MYVLQRTDGKFYNGYNGVKTHTLLWSNHRAIIIPTKNGVTTVLNTLKDQGVTNVITKSIKDDTHNPHKP